MGRFRGAGLAAACLAMGLALGVGPASAAPVTIGQLAPNNPPDTCNRGPVDVLQSSVASGASYVVPPGYTRITSWSTNAGAGAGQTFELKVFRLVSGTTYLVVGHDGPHPLTPSSLNTFTTDIPVQPGDFVGLDDENAPAVLNACLFTTGDAGDVFLNAAGGDTPDGMTDSMTVMSPTLRLNIAATVAAVPAVTSIAPSSGPVSGGTSVAITGHDFTGATAVAFGGAPATSIKVNSDTSITAVTPAEAAGAADVRVTTVAGQSATSAADRFTFTSPPAPVCVVPKLKGKKLKAARKALKGADCALGKVKGPKSGKVKHQSQKPGASLPAGTKVKVKLA